MKKIMVLLILFTLNIYAEDFELKTLSLFIKEKTKINNQIKNKEYSLEIEFPDKLIKKIYKPNVNNGEIYKYNGNKKEIYYPLFEEYVKKDIDEDENYLMDFFNEIKMYNNKKTNILLDEEKKVYYNKEKLLEKIIYNDGFEIIFENYLNLIPQIIKTFEGGSLISELEIQDIKINPEFTEKMFIIE